MGNGVPYKQVAVTPPLVPAVMVAIVRSSSPLLETVKVEGPTGVETRLVTIESFKKRSNGQETHFNDQQNKQTHCLCAVDFLTAVPIDHLESLD